MRMRMMKVMRMKVRMKRCVSKFAHHYIFIESSLFFVFWLEYKFNIVCKFYFTSECFFCFVSQVPTKAAPTKAALPESKIDTEDDEDDSDEDESDDDQVRLVFLILQITSDCRCCVVDAVTFSKVVLFCNCI